MKHNNKSLIGKILVILTILVLLFSIWFFFIRNNKPITSKSNKQTIKEKINKKEEPVNTKEDIKVGNLMTIFGKDGNPIQNEFIIDGIILIGDNHSYFNTDDKETIINTFLNEGFKKEDINNEFYLEEKINLYLDTKYDGEDSNIKILLVPHNSIEEFDNKEFSLIEKLASEEGYILNYVKPTEENNKYIGSMDLNNSSPEGYYDILFIYNNKIAYYLVINLKKNIVK